MEWQGPSRGNSEDLILCLTDLLNVLPQPSHSQMSCAMSIHAKSQAATLTERSPSGPVLTRLASLETALSVALQDAATTLRRQQSGTPSSESAHSSWKQLSSGCTVSPSYSRRMRTRQERGKGPKRPRSPTPSHITELRNFPSGAYADEATSTYKRGGRRQSTGDLPPGAYGSEYRVGEFVLSGPAQSPKQWQGFFSGSFPFLDVESDTLISQWATRFSIPAAALSLGTSYFLRLARRDPFMSQEMRISSEYACFSDQLDMDQVDMHSNAASVIGESVGYDNHAHQGPECWLLAVHLACVHVAWRMLGDLPQTSPGLLTTMLCDVHGEAISTECADHLEQQVIAALHHGLPMQSHARKSFE